MKTLKPLEKHNAERANTYKKSNDPHPNGIACPKCGKELWDSDPGTTLTSSPPQKNVHCPACKYVGYRVA